MCRAKRSSLLLPAQGLHLYYGSSSNLLPYSSTPNIEYLMSLPFMLSNLEDVQGWEVLHCLGDDWQRWRYLICLPSYFCYSGR